MYRVGVSEREDKKMKRHRKRVLAGIVAASAVVATAMLVVPALATPPSGLSVTPLAPVAQFDEINENAKSGAWKAQVKTKGLSDLHVVEATIQPGGTIGWHSHQGPSFVIVKSGTATFYHGDDPTCTPHVIPTGSSLFEPANNVHIVRNEGSVPLVNVIVQLIPTGAPRLISEPSPGNCPF
jgi:quercetin dioxygenase-like cupin family protein